MSHLTARVHNGRLVLDVPTELPEGTEIEFVASESQDNLSADERTRLHATLERALAQAGAGQTVPAADFLSRLRQSR